MTTLIISNQEMNYILKIVSSLENAGYWQRVLVLLGTLSTNLLGNLMTAKRAVRAGEGTIRGGKRTIRPGDVTPSFN